MVFAGFEAISCLLKVGAKQKLYLFLVPKGLGSQVLVFISTRNHSCSFGCIGVRRVEKIRAACSESACGGLKLEKLPLASGVWCCVRPDRELPNYMAVYHVFSYATNKVRAPCLHFPYEKIRLGAIMVIFLMKTMVLGLIVVSFLMNNTWFSG